MSDAMMTRIILILGVVLVTVPTGAVEDSVSQGEGRLLYSYPHIEQPIPVWYSAPPGLSRNSPVVIVMHGNGRTARGYRDAWKRHAHRYGFLLVVAEFSEESFPGSLSYHQGNRFQRSGKANPESKWTFSVIDPLFEHVKKLTGNRSRSFILYGHSAGAQFVHRFLYFKPKSRVGIAVAANAGWYTMPDLGTRHPYGLGDSGADEKLLAGAFKKRLVVFLGDQDTDPKDPLLRRSAEAMAQGAHRFERGHMFIRIAGENAKAMGVKLRWSLEVAPGVAHSNSGMAKATAGFLFDDR